MLYLDSIYGRLSENKRDYEEFVARCHNITVLLQHKDNSVLQVKDNFYHDQTEKITILVPSSLEHHARTRARVARITHREEHSHNSTFLPSLSTSSNRE